MAPGVALVALVALVAPWLPGLVAVSPAQTGTTIMLSVELPERPTTGAKLFAQKGCVRCHSLEGSEPRVGPPLGAVLFKGNVLDLAGSFWNHAPVMRERMQALKIQNPTMSVADMANLLAFLTSYRYYLTEVGEPGDPTNGSRIFEQKGCAGCHGDGADSWGRPGPSLIKYRSRESALFLAQEMWNHGDEMATSMAGDGVPWPAFAPREMGDLAAYLRAGGEPSMQSVYFEPGSPSRGRDLFQSKECAQCHAVAGKGGRGGPDLGVRGADFVRRSVTDLAGLMWNHSNGMTTEFARRGIRRVMFSGKEMVDIIAYLYFINYANVSGTPARGAQLFVDKCSACHAVREEAGPGSGLAVASTLDEPIAIIATMWNHSPDMERELLKRGLDWPRVEQGEMADLMAFLLTKRIVVRQSGPG